MTSLTILSLLASSTYALNFFMTVGWGTMPALTSNTPFTIHTTLTFPDAATWITPHGIWPFIAYSPDEYSITTNLAHTNGSVIRPLLYDSKMAADGSYNIGQFVLPSYILPAGQASASFCFQMVLTDLSFLPDFLDGAKTTSLSPPFTITRASAAQLAQSMAVPDARFKLNGDLNTPTAATSLYYALFGNGVETLLSMNMNAGGDVLSGAL